MPPPQPERPDEPPEPSGPPIPRTLHAPPGSIHHPIFDTTSLISTGLPPGETSQPPTDSSPPPGESCDSDEPLDPAFGPPLVEGDLGSLGNYRIVRRLGAGAMGIVYEAFYLPLQKTRAIKLMNPTIAHVRPARSRFLREARTAAHVEHEHVLRIHDVIEIGEVAGIAMEMLKGYDLADYLSKKGRPSLRSSVKIVREAALGLAAAHSEGVVHRDIKPANVWLEQPNGKVKIVDFGMAKSLDGAFAGFDKTQSGQLLGTPAYMSPEQARAEPVDGRSDQFSLGILLYELCAGERPFNGRGVMDVIITICTQPAERLDAVNAEVPKRLADLVERMLQKDAADRFPNLTEVATELRQIGKELANPRVERVAVKPLVPPVESVPDLDVQAPPVAAPPRLKGRRPQPAWDESMLMVTNIATSAVPPPHEPRGGQTTPASRRSLLLRLWLGMLVLTMSAASLAYLRDRPSTAKVAEESLKENLQQPLPTTIEPPPPKAVSALVEKKEAVSPKVVEKKMDEPPAVVPPPQSPKAGEERAFEIFPGLKVPFCWMPAGEAMLGDPADEHEYQSKGFWLMKYELTQDQWKRVMEGTEIADPSWFKGGRLPVEFVSWDDARMFMKRCSAVRGMSLGLPHEDEWEYAYRGGLGNGRTYYWGDTLNGDKANCDGTSPAGTDKKGAYLQKTTEVGTYEKAAPHPWNLCDMSGNVHEWCGNSHSTENVVCVYRGGSWLDDASRCRASLHYRGEPALRNMHIGFRLRLRPE